MLHLYVALEEEVQAIAPGSCMTAENSLVPDPPCMAPVSGDTVAMAMKSLFLF